MEAYYKTRVWQEIKEGEQLSEIKLFISYIKIIENVVATHDFFPGHHNPEYARAQGVKSIYLSTRGFQGVVDRLVTDNFGPKVWIRGRRMRMRTPVPAESNISVGGYVSKKYIENGEHLVEVDVTVSREDGATTEVCKAIVTALFPSE